MRADCIEIRLGPGRRGYIVPWHKVRDPDALGPVDLELDTHASRQTIRARVRRLSHREAVDVLRMACDDHSSARNIQRLVGHFDVSTWDQQRLLDTVADLLAHGQLVLLEDEDMGPGWAGSPRRRDRAEQAAPLTKIPREGTTGLRARVVLDDGAPLADCKVMLTAPDGQAAELVANSRGEAELVEVAVEGTGHAVVRPAKAPRWRGEAEVTAFSEHTFDFPFGATATADLPTSKSNLVVLRRPEVGRIDGGSLGFALDSPLLIPLAEDRSPS